MLKSNLQIVGAVFKKDLKSFFVSRSSYFVAAAFFMLAAYFFFSLLGSFNLKINELATLPFEHPQRAKINLNQMVIEPYYRTLSLIFILIVPVFAMSTFASERKSGGFKMMLSSFSSVALLIVAKFVSLMSLTLMLLFVPISYVGILYFYADPELGISVIGILGLILSLSFYCAIALCCAALSGNSLSAVLSGVLVLLFLYGLSVPQESIGGYYELFISAISPLWHLNPLIKGVLSMTSVVYFIGWSFLALYLASLALREEFYGNN